MTEATNLTESFLNHLVKNNVLDPEGALQVLDAQRQQTPPIGRIALMAGYLNMKQVFEVLQVQADTGLRFGEQAIALGYLDERQLTDLLNEQRQQRPGAGHLIAEMGLARKGVLQKNRRQFLREMEALLV